MELIQAAGRAPRDEYYRGLEEGNILFFPGTPFLLPETDLELLRNTGQASGAHHKNIAYRPAENRVTGFDKSSVADPARLRDAMRTYSQHALEFLQALLPRYMQGCRVDFASFRPQEEEGRHLPLKKRNDLLHVDSFPSRPTRGGLILRLFTNINPSQPRVWVTSDPFLPLATRYAAGAGLRGIAESAQSALGRARERLNFALKGIGLPVKNRSAYDRFMLRFHDYLKGNAAYQRDCSKYRFEFPPGSTWMVFTDVVPHAVLSGRYALEQTVMTPRENLLSPERAPVSILEKLCGVTLAAG